MAETLHSSLFSRQAQSFVQDSPQGLERPCSNSTKRLLVTCATQSTGGGTRMISSKRVKVLEEGGKSSSLRDKVSGERATVKLLSRVEQLRLLTKAEKAGLLSAAENAGLSLSTIEKFGLLSKAESLGVLSAATDPGTPAFLLTLSLALLLAGPAVVYFVPEEATWQVILQYAVAVLAVIGGSVMFAASNFVSSLQKSD